MKKEAIRNGIISSTLGIALLVGVINLEEKEEIPEQSHSYDDFKKYDNHKVRDNLNLNLANEFIHNGKVLKFKKEKTAKLRNVIKLEKQQKEKERLALIEKQKQEKLKKLEKESNEKWITIEGEEWEVYNVSFYTAHVASTGKNKGHKDYGRTASGTYVKEGRTIACPKNIPFGTKVEIEGLGIRYCEDRGGAIVSGHLDVYVDSEIKAKQLGRKYINVKIYKNEK